MSKTDFGTIHDQTDLSQTAPLGLQPVLRDRSVPFPDIDRRVIQKTAQTPGSAHQFRLARDLPGDPAQIHRMTLIDTDHQPHKVSYLRDSLVRPQFTNSLHPVMIEIVDRHSTAPVVRFLGRSLLYSVLRADQHLFTKLSGR